MKFNLVTAPTSLAVSVANMKTHLRREASFTDHDTLIQTYIEAATKEFEQRANLAICFQTWDLYLNYKEVQERIEITKFPVNGIAQIVYYDADNVLQSLTSSNGDYISFINGRPASVILDDYPTTYERDDAMRIRFTAGFSTVPDDIELAIKMMVWRIYFNPNDPVDERRSYVDKIIADYRLWE